MTCYGQFLLPVCKELNVCKRITGDRLRDQNRDYARGECPVFDRSFLKTDKIDSVSPRCLTFHNNPE